MTAERLPTRRFLGRNLSAGPDQSWLELFYDLSFVASIVVLTGSYSRDKSWSNSMWLLLVACGVWVAWLETTLLTNRTTLTRFWPRVLTVVQMALVLMMSITADDTTGDHTELTGPLFAIVLVTIALQYFAALRQQPEHRTYLTHHATRVLIAAGIFVATPLYGDLWFWLPWVIGLALIVFPGRASNVDETIDGHHLVHRFGEFTIIVLGEAFLKIGLVASEEPLDRVDLIGLPLTFAVIYVIWWLYFTDIAPSGLPEGIRRRRWWIAAHLPLQVSLMSLAVGLSLILNPTVNAVDAQYMRMILVPLIVIATSFAVLNASIGSPLAVRRARVHGVAAVALLLAFGVLQVFGRLHESTAAITAIAVLGVDAYVIRRLDDAAPEG
ncbi:MAG: low temperature requirement protein A [Microthrixaceae bacterium]|jgi:low temperature requirement protein LtrA